MLNPNEQTGKPAKSKSVSRKPAKVKSVKAKSVKAKSVKAKSVKATPAKVPERIEDFDFMCFPSGKPFTISREAFEALERDAERPGRYIPALAAAMKRMRENTTDG